MEPSEPVSALRMTRSPGAPTIECVGDREFCASTTSPELSPEVMRTLRVWEPMYRPVPFSISRFSATTCSTVAEGYDTPAVVSAVNDTPELSRLNARIAKEMPHTMIAAAIVSACLLKKVFKGGPQS